MTLKVFLFAAIPCLLILNGLMLGQGTSSSIVIESTTRNSGSTEITASSEGAVNFEIVAENRGGHLRSNYELNAIDGGRIDGRHAIVNDRSSTFFDTRLNAIGGSIQFDELVTAIKTQIRRDVVASAIGKKANVDLLLDYVVIDSKVVDRIFAEAMGCSSESSARIRLQKLIKGRNLNYQGNTELSAIASDSSSSSIDALRILDEDFATRTDHLRINSRSFQASVNRIRTDQIN